MEEAGVSAGTSSCLPLPSEYRKKLRSSTTRQQPTINSASTSKRMHAAVDPSFTEPPAVIDPALAVIHLS
ncbi:hypothetical protein [Parasitella parasitica]|uniref:Uncharacterized protein n=1 Tax=Parasitella parasitica TaxID=35722 RepID=A0A0B7N9T6_9FUNG|nr:hypothetical protein [Parasitella parasitica]